MSKNLTLSDNFTKDSSNITFDNSQLPPILGGLNAIGSETPESNLLGNKGSNVQSAVEDLAGISIALINEVRMFTEDADPNGISMIERLTISGSADTHPLFVYGVPVAVKSTDTIEIITQNIFEKLLELKANTRMIKLVTKVSGQNNMIDVEFIDTKTRPNYNHALNTLIIKGSTIQEAIPGYGTWTRIGVIESTFNNTKIPVNLFKRIA